MVVIGRFALLCRVIVHRNRIRLIVRPIKNTLIEMRVFFIGLLALSVFINYCYNNISYK
jgi:hypothetical protein